MTPKTRLRIDDFSVNFALVLLERHLSFKMGYRWTFSWIKTMVV